MAGLKKNMKIYSKLMARAWMDPKFKKKLCKNPKKVMEAEGILLPKGLVIKILPGKTKTIWDMEKKELLLPLPPKPKGLSDQCLEKFESDGTGFSKITCFSVMGI